MLTVDCVYKDLLEDTIVLREILIVTFIGFSGVIPLISYVIIQIKL